MGGRGWGCAPDVGYAGVGGPGRGGERQWWGEG